MAALREVAFIVTADEVGASPPLHEANPNPNPNPTTNQVGASPPLHEAAVLLIKLGATNVLSKPIPQEP